ncbi:F0F1 ATP synthase subunit epsilon [Virgibacillus sp. LDC1]|uniref:F0F1 ATP synthase subunit epsilon n=1 Tax=Paenibacillus TaxID=44249 RepID=UPI000C27867F|nr:MULTISPECIES: F0F1 ATP synthase subunit epsilon [Paenibacillus]MCV4235440.1 F0F1 ATP synthase subunit epsilon [Virgibacillus sp. LDC1]MBU5349253.1 F0F1 ATP synthase subunit epsilon [Paenibacillus lautus]MBX4152206.1 F0F1 ATP synthase subunit epsilon [Paenibacillus lautus]MCT1402506.1 F0F1 ATP synthase subunit epsilon [Paenibacillus sp. p3-SID867]MEC0253649.1 F0F1 ATP synthase subunit epsilon [Paenibacillus lautus]
MSTILLEIVTPDRLVYSEQVNSVTVRGVEGELGILPGHISFVTPLQIAPVYVKIGNQRTPFAVQGGFVEVRKDKIVILAESAEKAEEIDLERAEAAKERAETRLNAKGRQDEVDHRRAEMALQRAMNRIKVTRN